MRRAHGQLSDSRTREITDEQRLFIGLAIQPFVTALLGFALFAVVDYTGRPLYGGRPIDPFDAAIGFGFGLGVAGLFVSVLGACPVLVWLLRRGPVKRNHALISGVALGNVPSVLIVGGLAISRLTQGVLPNLSDLSYGLSGAVRALIFGSLIGAVAAAVFWRVAAGNRLEIRLRLDG